jgi:cytochrome c553
MATVGFVALFLLLGLGVLFVAFSGGPSRARETYLTRGRRVFTATIVILYIAVGITIPAVVISDREEGPGGGEALADVRTNNRLEDGKDLFRSTCASCHNLDAVNARGVTGPDLDEIGGPEGVDPIAVKEAILYGGSVGKENAGTGRMPPQLLGEADADKVAAFVAAVAGK